MYDQSNNNVKGDNFSLLHLKPGILIELRDLHSVHSSFKVILLRQDVAEI